MVVRPPIGRPFAREYQEVIVSNDVPDADTRSCLLERSNETVQHSEAV